MRYIISYVIAPNRTLHELAWYSSKYIWHALTHAYIYVYSTIQLKYHKAYMCVSMQQVWCTHHIWHTETYITVHALDSNNVRSPLHEPPARKKKNKNMLTCTVSSNTMWSAPLFVWASIIILFTQLLFIVAFGMHRQMQIPQMTNPIILTDTIALPRSIHLLFPPNADSANHTNINMHTERHYMWWRAPTYIYT